ncbi:AAA+-type ATPase [Handroanthus impetiginosus]|uniref:AAA+-type ATPase n=1 Tax=Handroanthus impetiginosus TaxID=429701 RepID=A0A2G9FYM4_9LAMI|nr:AAA+-type ATPase [Handroanthus impetiginosus]
MMLETLGTLGSTVLTFMFFWEMFQRYCPTKLKQYLEKYTIRLSESLNPYIQISIDEYIGNHMRTHEAYGVVEAYLSVNSLKDAKRLKAEMARDSDSKLMLRMDQNEKITEEFNGVRVQWTSGNAPPPSRPGFSHYMEPERRFYMLKFHKQYKDVITGSYLEHVVRTGKEIRARNRQRKLYSNGHGKYWSHIVFEHPARFETLAMEKEKKEEIIEDLWTFTTGKDFYARIGKAWKRGYLLHGPPGTGKSTMVAAMANLLNYDVYDLELTSVRDNTELKRLLTETTAKSIIVIEDIDCSLNLTGQRKASTEKKPEENETEKDKKGTLRKEKDDGDSKVTLSGLLNSIDGLWSSCAGERLIVFTTNHVDKLDPALTRRGRMDKHIEFSYCRYEGFKVLAKNYLDLEEHPLFQSQCLLNLIRTLDEIKERKIIKSTEEINDDKGKNKNADAPQEKHET